MTYSAALNKVVPLAGQRQPSNSTVDSHAMQKERSSSSLKRFSGSFKQSSLREGVRCVFRSRRKDSGYHTARNSVTDAGLAPAQLPLDPKVAEAAAKLFVAQKSGGGAWLNNNDINNNDNNNNARHKAKPCTQLRESNRFEHNFQRIQHVPAQQDAGGFEKALGALEDSTDHYNEMPIKKWLERLHHPSGIPTSLIPFTPEKPSNVTALELHDREVGYDSPPAMHVLMNAAEAEAAAIAFVAGNAVNDNKNIPYHITLELDAPNVQHKLHTHEYVYQTIPGPDAINSKHDFSTQASVNTDEIEIAQLQCPIVQADIAITCNVLCQHVFIKTYAYKAILGHPQALRDMDKVYERLGFDDNPIVNIGRLAVRKTDLSKSDRRWIRRVKFIIELHGERMAGRLADQDFGSIVKQLFPESSRSIMERECFEIYVDSLVREQTWCDGFRAIELDELRVTEEEHKRGPSVNIIPPPAPVPRDFHMIPLHNGSGHCFRFQSLRSLVEAAVYERQEWQGISYQDGLGQLNLYYAAYVHSKSGSQRLPSKLADYYRDWNYKEQRLLRAGHLLSRLLKQTSKGALGYYPFKLIRGALLRVPGQPYCSQGNLKTFLLSGGVDNGLKLDDVADVLILHPDEVSSDRLKSESDEPARYQLLLEYVEQYREEERVRLHDIKMAKQAYREATGANRFPARMKRIVKKLLGRGRKAEPFSCPGCTGGGCYKFHGG